MKKIKDERCCDFCTKNKQNEILIKNTILWKNKNKKIIKNF